MSKYRTTDEYDEDEDDYLAKVPTRFQQVVRKPQKEAIPRPNDYWGWY